jgi:hypothetical protein
MSWENMNRPEYIRHLLPRPKGKSMANALERFEVENAQDAS